MNEFQRATAYKIWIGDLINGSYKSMDPLANPQKFIV